MATLARRNFMVGCSAAIAAMATSRLSHIAFGSPENEPSQNILLVIFLRGGIDGLSVIPIVDGPDRAHYEANREDIAIPTTGDGAALPLNESFGLHPAASPLLELYQDEMLSIVVGTGLENDTRSHFDAMKMMELGTPGVKNTHTGWLTRHLLTAGSLAEPGDLPAIAVGNLQPTAFAGSSNAVGLSSPKDFGFGGYWRYENFQRSALRKMYGGDSWIHAAGSQTLDAIDRLELADPGTYEPSNGAAYPSGSFGSNLQAVAQMIKMQLGVSTATVDFGGWDTHEYQGDDGGGYFASRIEEVARGLNAFYTDLSSNPHGSSAGQRVTTVVMSEFGRSLKQNGSRGTDHGHGNMMLILGHHVNGGIHGTWPGLALEQLYDNRDLRITTDYRQVLSEIINKRFANPHLGTVFPGLTEYQPLNLVAGTSVTPNFENLMTTPSDSRTQEDSGGDSLYLPLISG